MRRSEMRKVIADSLSYRHLPRKETADNHAERILSAIEIAGMLPPTIGRPGAEVDEYGPFDFINEWESEASHVNDATGYIADE